jgi:CheY-like chemotaxis protein
VYAIYLRYNGFDVYEASDGATGVTRAIELQPDVIVMDLAMADLDGWTATSRLAAHPLTCHIPVVILSAHAFPADESRAREAGAAAFLRKPCGPEELAATVRAVSERCDATFRSSPAPAAPAG